MCGRRGNKLHLRARVFISKVEDGLPPGIDLLHELRLPRHQHPSIPRVLYQHFTPACCCIVKLAGERVGLDHRVAEVLHLQAFHARRPRKRHVRLTLSEASAKVDAHLGRRDEEQRPGTGDGEEEAGERRGGEERGRRSEGVE
eukprot:763280-Hanusia_phi.AAC.3